MDAPRRPAPPADRHPHARRAQRRSIIPLYAVLGERSCLPCGARGAEVVSPDHRCRRSSRRRPPSAMTTEIAHVDAAVPAQMPSRRTYAATSASCAPLESRRRGSGDTDRHQLAGLGRPGEIHGGVAAGSTAEQRGIGAARSLDEDLFHQAHAACVSLGRDALDDLDEALDALALQLVGHLIGHRRRLSPVAR